MATDNKKHPVKAADGGSTSGGFGKLELLKPPSTLIAPAELSEAEKAFLQETEATDDGPMKLPFVTIDHKTGCFMMPSGDSIDGAEGLCGFIIGHFMNRAYYEKAYSPKGDKLPPDCKSSDCITPDADVAEPKSKSCLTCPFNEFKSASVGEGKACKERIWMFLVSPEFGDPPLATLILPPTAIKAFYGGQMKRGFFDQMKAKTKLWQLLWVKITLGKEVPDQIHYVPEFEMGEMPSADVGRAVGRIHKQFFKAISEARSSKSAALAANDAVRKGEEVVS